MNPDEMRSHLLRKMIAQRPGMDAAARYYDGKQPMKWIDPRISEAVRDRVQPLNVNFARLAVDSLAARLRVTGFRSSPGEVMDARLAALWQRNGMDEQAQMAQVGALVHGRAFFMAWPDATGRARVTAESALQFAVQRDPATSQVVGALKRWQDGDGMVRTLLLTPDQVLEYASGTPAPADPMLAMASHVAVDRDAVLVRADANPLGVVPVVALVNRPTLEDRDGASDLVDLFPLVDAIGKLGSDLMVTSEYAAVPRRWATGVTDAEKLNSESARWIQEQWENLPAVRTVVTGSTDAKFGTFEQPELTNFTAAIDMITSQVSSLACLPSWHVLASVANPTSADAIRASESRLTIKARERQRWFSGAYEDLMRLVARIESGSFDAALDDLETLWEDPAPATVAQTADAQAKLIGAGITDKRSALESLGMTPLEVDRILTEGTTP